jgi:hypothetical protein
VRRRLVIVVVDLPAHDAAHDVGDDIRLSLHVFLASQLTE